MKRCLTLILLAVLMPGLACAKTKTKAKQAEPEMLIPAVRPMVVTYDVYVGGVNLVTADILFEQQASRYRARVLGRTAGFWYNLFPWNTELRVEGKIREDRFIPTEFFTRDVWDENPKSVWLHFKKDGDIKPEFDPPNTDQNREEVTRAQRIGALDPVTGLLQLLAHVSIYNSCNVTVPIFEGKRRFDITGIDVGHEEIDEEGYSAFKGKARTCDADFTMVAGEWKDRTPDRKFWSRDNNEKGREPFHIWLGALEPEQPEMAVRLESGSVWGLIVMHLSAWHYATPEELSFEK